MSRRRNTGSDSLDWMSPVNRDHSLNHGLVAWWMALPNQPGWKSSVWLDLMNPLYGYNATLAGMTPETAWQGPIGNRGGLGSILFDDAASQYAEYAGAALTSTPLTMACMFNSDDAAISQVLMSIGTTQAAEQARFQLVAAGAAAGDPIRAAAINAAGTGGTASSSSGYSVNTRHHACGVFPAADLRAAYIDGGSKGTETTSITPTNLDRTTIGAVAVLGTHLAFMSGRVNDCRIWNRALSDEEVMEVYLDSRQGCLDTLNWINAMSLGAVAQLRQRTLMGMGV